MAKSGGESTLTVLLAMGANLAVGVAKLVAGLLTGSAAMLSEAAHSVGDTMTEVLLLAALKRSAKPPDRTHPFGYGKERYVFSLLAAVSIFVAGALFSIYQGVHTLLGGPEERQDVLVAMIVLVVAAAIEGVSLTKAIRQVNSERREERLDLLTFVRRSDDPTVITVLFEDSAAITGLVIAFAGVGLTALTGSQVWDGLASLLIGLLLVIVAYGLTRTNMALLIGRQADPRIVRAIGRRLAEQTEVDEVVDLLTMLTGTDKVLVCARLDFAQIRDVGRHRAGLHADRQHAARGVRRRRRGVPGAGAARRPGAARPGPRPLRRRPARPRAVTTLLIRPDRVFDGTRVLGAAVLVRDGVIVEVGPELSAPDAVVVDAPGQTLLPGFIDAHTHVFPGRLEQALAFGVTTELDMFADPSAVAELRRETTDRAALRSAGTGATAPGGHPCQLVDSGLVPPFPTIASPHEAARFVADRVAEGSDYLKVFLEGGTSTGRTQPVPDDATVRALVAAGHDAGLLVVAHATDAAAARTAVDAGVDGLVHIWVDGPAPDLVAAIAAADVFVVPTLTVVEGLWGTGAGARALADEPRVAPYLDDVSRAALDTGGIGLGPDGPARAAAAVGVLHAAGVPLLVGTDAANPGTAHGASVHHELRLLVAAGLLPVEALRAATAEPAARFRLGDRGRVAPGLVADLVLVAGDPTRYVTATAAITAVWRRGVRLERDTYAAALSPTRRRSTSVAWTRSRPPRAGSRPSGPGSSARPDALFTDPFAATLAGGPGRALAEWMRGDSPVESPTLAVRTRFFDDVVTAAVARTAGTDHAPAEQVVVLAAGMDARAYRLDLPADLPWFELDRPALLAVKERVLAGVAPRCRRCAIGCDLADDWPAALLGAGFDPARSTVWLVEGLLAYLDGDVVDLLLDRLTVLAAPGSHLLCDPVGESLLASPWMRPYLARLAEAGTPWRFGTDRPEALLEPRGWRPTVALMADVATGLGRWSFPQMPRDTPGVPQSFLVHARR